uniref:Uncharacterized protein n=1 Tax=Tetranychus urticae TaxID=32264 RepID=T1KB23_TETUR
MFVLYYLLLSFSSNNKGNMDSHEMKNYSQLLLEMLVQVALCWLNVDFMLAL